MKCLASLYRAQINVFLLGWRFNADDIMVGACMEFISSSDDRTEKGISSTSPSVDASAECHQCEPDVARRDFASASSVAKLRADAGKPRAVIGERDSRCEWL